jgi:hypothetical protein
MKNIKDAYLSILKNKVEPTQQLVETTVPEELHHIPESWDHHSHVSEETYDKMRKALPHGSFTHFPLNSIADADADVVDHLTKHGYEVKDYRAGIASTKKVVGDPSKGIPHRVKTVDEKIGSILERTNASSEVKSSFMNDPARSLKSSDDQHVVISTTPLAIAGMSTGTHWRDQSCMNMQGGSMNHKLADDSMHGTHVAFLVHGNDKTAFAHGEPSNPIARIALKPFHTKISGEKDTIFRPETKSYGNASSNFHTAVSHWANTNYPAIEGQHYIKNRDVYDDSGNDEYYHMSKEDVEKKIINGDRFDDGAIDHHNISHAINFAKTYCTPTETDTDKEKEGKHAWHKLSLRNIAKIPNLTSEHIAKVYNHTMALPETSVPIESKNKVVEALAFTHGDKTSSAINNHYMNMGVYDYPTKSMMMNPKLSDEHLDKVLPHDYMHVRLSKIKDSHIDKLVNTATTKDHLFTGVYSRTFNHLKSKLNSDHIHKLVDSENTLGGMVPTLSTLPTFTREHHDHALKTILGTTNDALKSVSHSALMSNSRHATMEDAEHFPSDDMYTRLMHNEHIPKSEHKKLAHEFINNAIGGDPDTRSTRYGSHVFGFKTKNALPESLTEHFTHEDYSKLAEHNYRMSFGSEKHSNKFLDAAENRAFKLDSGITEHINTKNAADDEYDEDDDHELTAKKEQLYSHLENYAMNLDNHIDEHVIDEDRVSLKDWHESEKLHTRIHTLDSLEHYKTPNTASRYHEHEHYDEHFDPVYRRVTDSENYDGGY